MKSAIRSSGTIMLICCFLCVFPNVVFAHGLAHKEHLPEVAPEEGIVEPLRSVPKGEVFGPPKPVGEHFSSIPTPGVRLLDTKSVILKFDVLRAIDEEIKGLDAVLTKQGFRAGGECKDCSGGFLLTSKANSKLLGIEPGDPRGNEVTTTFYIQNYESTSETNDTAAIVQVIIKSGEHKDSYSCALIAPGGNFGEATEYKIVNGQLVRAHS